MQLTSYTLHAVKEELKDELFRIWINSDLEDWYLSQHEMRDLHILYHNLLKEQE